MAQAILRQTLVVPMVMAILEEFMEYEQSVSIRQSFRLKPQCTYENDLCDSVLAYF